MGGTCAERAGAGDVAGGRWLPRRGTFINRYEVAHQAEARKTTVITVNHPTEGAIANVTGIVQTPNSEMVQVNYNRVVPETVEGSLDEPRIRELLLMGISTPATNGVRANCGFAAGERVQGGT